MPITKLTKSAVERLPAPDPSGRQLLHLDSELRGFGVLCSGTSSVKSYIAQKRLPAGQLRRVTIGSCGALPLNQARARARELLVEMAKGVDPAAERRRERASTLRSTFASFLKTRKDLRLKTVEIYRHNVERHLAAWLDRPLSQITPDDVEDLHATIGKRAGEASANSAFRVFRTLYNFASDRDDTLPANPVRRLRKAWFPQRVRERSVTEAQLPAFYEAVNNLPSRIARDYLLLLLFTGLRRREAANLRWDEIDFSARVIRLAADRTKGRRRLDLPMTTFVRDLLVARRTLGNDGPYVFPANSVSGHIEEPRFPLRLVEQQTGITVAPHDIRRSFVTIAESCDISPTALRALVNHSLGRDVTSGYIQMTVERLREPAQRVCDRLMERCGIEVPPEVVVRVG